MTQEDKKILLKDLSARLPYGVIANFTLGDISFNERVSSVFVDECSVQVYVKQGFLKCPLDGDSEIKLSQVKPYLRPMSSMTAEEREEIEVFICDEWFVDDDKATKVDSEGFIEFLSNYDCSGIYPEFCGQYVDWLLSHHFDYRIDPSTGKTLIESGLALEAPEGMYKID